MNERQARGLSQTTKAVKLRESRVSRRNERRFNVPLREFLKHKYPAIYDEYAELFQVIITAHPQRWKLTSTPTFRRWKKNNPPAAIPPTCSDLLTQVLQETLGTPDQSRPQEHENIQETPDQSRPQEHENIQETPDQSRPQEHENIQETPDQSRPQEHENIRAEIDDIINQLEADDAVRDIIAQPYPVGDEGISLDPFEEMQGDIHEFDFALEVELGDC